MDNGDEAIQIDKIQNIASILRINISVKITTSDNNSCSGRCSPFGTKIKEFPELAESKIKLRVEKKKILHPVSLVELVKTHKMTQKLSNEETTIKSTSDPSVTNKCQYTIDAFGRAHKVTKALCSNNHKNITDDKVKNLEVDQYNGRFMCPLCINPGNNSGS